MLKEAHGSNVSPSTVLKPLLFLSKHPLIKLKKNANFGQVEQQIAVAYGFRFSFGVTFVCIFLNYKKGKYEKVNFYVAADFWSLCSETSF